MALEDYGLLALRVVLGIIFMYHGYPKIKNPEMMIQVFGNKKIPDDSWLIRICFGIISFAWSIYTICRYCFYYSHVGGIVL